uniref:Alternative protein PLSCR5 n=1 Tax=Homo sapiens TaxID=9606 RepID=L8EC74_HUMAN|nr:alternative protein PLSCR5 [Homo sapiens]
MAAESPSAKQFPANSQSPSWSRIFKPVRPDNYTPAGGAAWNDTWY